MAVARLVNWEHTFLAVTVPVVVISSVSMKDEMAKQYGVVAVYDKGELTPADIIAMAEEYDGKKSA